LTFNPETPSSGCHLTIENQYIAILDKPSGGQKEDPDLVYIGA